MSKALQKESILIVDNDFNTLKLLSTYFMGEGFVVRIAKSTENAQLSIDKERPDLIIIDCDTPKLGGYQFSLQLQKHYRTRDIAIIFTGFRDDPQSVLNAYESGGVDYLRKPLRIEKLIARINIQLKLVKQLKELQDFNRIMMGREERILELKKEVNQLSVELDKAQPYSEARVRDQDD